MNEVVSTAKQHQIEVIGALCMAATLMHTFLTPVLKKIVSKIITKLSGTKHQPSLVSTLHFFTEIEVIFALWATLFLLVATMIGGLAWLREYIAQRHFNEVGMVTVLLLVAGTKPVLYFASKLLHAMASMLERNLKKWPIMSTSHFNCFVFTTLSIGSLLGSFITEPAAITLVVLLLRESIFANENWSREMGRSKSIRIKWLVFATILVNISVGGALTNFAAPPVLMVVHQWGWSTKFVFQKFGWPALLTVFINSFWVSRMITQPAKSHQPRVDHLSLTTILKNALFVGLFLSALIILGGVQSFWITPVIHNLTSVSMYIVSTVLTTITDNAALTYLGSQVANISESVKFALLSGSLVGGGLTLIANAPNMIAHQLVQNTDIAEDFSHWQLFRAALAPTVVAVICFAVFTIR